MHYINTRVRLSSFSLFFFCPHIFHESDAVDQPMFSSSPFMPLQVYQVRHMQHNIIGSIKQQSEDLRDELNDLNEWENRLKKLEESRKRMNSEADEVIPPVRGTVPSIKDAIDKQTNNSSREQAPREDPVQIAKERGNEYFRVGNVPDAIHSYTTGIDLDPSGPSAHVLYGNRAMCHLKQEKWEDAEKDASMCVELDRSYAKGYFRRAIARKHLKKLKESRSDLEAVLALVPNDPSATSEMEVVTRMLKVERDRLQGTSDAPQKKKIAIKEVESDDEEDDGDDEKKARPTAATPETNAEQTQRDNRIRQHMAELEEARLNAERKGAEDALKEEKAHELRRRRDNRVEVIEECEEPEKMANEGTKHVDPVDSSEPVSTPTTDEPVVRRARSKPNKTTLSPPGSFTEFERVFLDVVNDDELRDYYVGLLNPAGLPSLFGSNLTSDILVGLLHSFKQMPGSSAFQFLKGISKINRVEDIALFFNPSEKKLLEDVISLVQSSGAPQNEINQIKKKLLI
ncbi:hypothetical protein AGDE_15511 [Angomonas deanei]|uniref:RNA polymerase II-associated protein 3 n=1 Tax=Angomonas deanei TaxID=59799 RepID=A0A7G2CTL4_9TRYP|nr:hypothetical protein AGDE_15511 [Angomonas deanei]CAD2221562.1 Tetratricopeptide repeat/Potential Monad-binding region of RPAP3, putative [Angomonas deanei]|eukprot:EPY18960.1 hypothetical protein AGDE_15511 [Angomonas deanei]